MLKKILALATAALLLFAVLPGLTGGNAKAVPAGGDAVRDKLETGELRWETEETPDDTEKLPPEPAAVSPEVTVTDATQYSYEVTPLLAPFAYYLYVKTDNPDPESFMLVDRQSVYFGEDANGEIWSQENSSMFSLVETDPGTYYIARLIFADAVYENEATYRVKGGYLFLTHGAYSDGGELVLKNRTADNGGVMSNTYAYTDVTVPCSELQTYTDWLITQNTSSSMSFFQKLDAIQSCLDGIAIYPRSALDSDSPSENYPYPLLATSPYPELTLNEHYNMFDYYYDGTLLYTAYPFVLDSASFPGTMQAVALMLDPNAVVEPVPNEHWSVNVTLNGETHKYGGAGRGGNDPLFTADAEKTFKFDNSTNDLGTHGTIEAYNTQFDAYEAAAEAGMAPYIDLVAGDTFRSTIAETGGTWMRVATEGWFGFGLTFTYAVPYSYYNYTWVNYATDTWVDGRYINQNEQVVLRAPFSAYPTAGILVHDVTFTDYADVTHTQDVIYRYNSDNDNWEAQNVPSRDQLILTRAEVEAIAASWTEGSRLPQSGLVYDGTEYPGTPFTNVLVEGISMPETLTMIYGSIEQLPFTVLPENASYPQVDVVSSDEDVIYCGTNGYVRAAGIGTAVVTVTSRDGGFTAVCLVTVRPDEAVNNALNVEDGALDFSVGGSVPFTVSEADGRSVVGIEGAATWNDGAKLRTQVSMNAGDCLFFDYYLHNCGSYSGTYVIFNAVGRSTIYYYGTSDVWTRGAFTAAETGVYTFEWQYIANMDNAYCMFDNIYVMRTPGPSLSEALNVEGGDIAFTTSGRMNFAVAQDGERIAAYAEGVADDGYNDSRIEADIHLEAGDRLYFEYKFEGDIMMDDIQFAMGDVFEVIPSADESWHSFSCTFEEAGDYSMLIRYLGNTNESRFMVDNVQVLHAGEPDPVISILGDVDGSSTVNANDALLLMRYALGLVPASALDLSVADVNHDGAVNANDALMIMRFALGLITIE